MKRIARFCIFSNLSMSPLRYGFQIVSPYSITDWTNNWIPNYGGNPTLMFIIELFNMNKYVLCIPVNPPPLRGSLPRKSLISRMDWVSCAGDINLPHTPFPPARSPPPIKYNKILTYILRSIFLEIPHLELPRWWKRQLVKVVTRARVRFQKPGPKFVFSLLHLC